MRDKLIKELEGISRYQVIIATPVGFLPSESSTPFQRHKSGYEPSEFEKQSYTVRGYMFRIPVVEKFVSRYHSFWWLALFLQGLLIPLAFFRPTKAVHMVCVKSVSE